MATSCLSNMVIFTSGNKNIIFWTVKNSEGIIDLSIFCNPFVILLLSICLQVKELWDELFDYLHNISEEYEDQANYHADNITINKSLEESFQDLKQKSLVDYSQDESNVKNSDFEISMMEWEDKQFSLLPMW